MSDFYIANDFEDQGQYYADKDFYERNHDWDDDDDEDYDEEDDDIWW